jgi:hypothetical protein
MVRAGSALSAASRVLAATLVLASGIGCEDARAPAGRVAEGSPASSFGAPAASGRPADAGRAAEAVNREADAAGASPSLPDGGTAAPLSAAEPFEELAVEGFGPAVVSLPLGARAAMPVLVATHGNYDRPEWQCEAWREVVADRAFVLCPRGIARGDSPSKADVRFTYTNNEQLQKEVEAALVALRQRHGPYLAEGPPLYAGFSLGAIMGVAIATREAAHYPRLVLVEGGSEWTWTRAKSFARGGGARVLFACSQEGSRLAAREAATKLEATGVATRVVYVGGLGHSYGGPLNAPIREAWSWLTEGDPRWTSSAPSAAPQ